jgi:CRISPR-associated protein Cmr5
MRTIEQHRAVHAQTCVTNVGDVIKAYKAAASGFPALIRMNGLGQALAFIRSRKTAEYAALYQHVSAWLCQKAAPPGPLAGGEDALDTLIQRDAQTYRQAETETIAVMVWIKRYAEAASLRAQAARKTSP